MLRYLVRLARRLIERGGLPDMPPDFPPDPFSTVRHPRGRGPGGRSSAVAVPEPSAVSAVHAVGRTRGLAGPADGRDG
jgi:hypothetical protein